MAGGFVLIFNVLEGLRSHINVKYGTNFNSKDGGWLPNFVNFPSLYFMIQMRSLKKKVQSTWKETYKFVKGKLEGRKEFCLGGGVGDCFYIQYMYVSCILENITFQ